MYRQSDGSLESAASKLLPVVDFHLLGLRAVLDRAKKG